MRTAHLLTGGIVAAAVMLGFATPAEKAKIEMGKALFERRCSGCHALDLNKEGPRLRSVYGRGVAHLADFTYSDALRKLTFKWDEASLGRWLADPDALAPGTDMAFRLINADERSAVIAYLKSISAAEATDR